MSSLLDNDINEELELNSYLTFELDKQIFAVEVNKVVEIQEITNITKIPNAPAHMAGVLNLRGRILPLIDTKVKFGLPPVEATVDTCIVVIEMVVEGETILIGALVDAVREVVSIEESAIQKSASIKAKFDLENISGTFKVGTDFIMLLNLDKAFAIEDKLYYVKEGKVEKNSKDK